MLNFAKRGLGTRKLGKKTVYKGVTFKSKFEAELARTFDEQGVVWEYEPDSFKFQPPPATYTPDFKLTNPDGTITYIEAKGYFDATDRTKMKCMKAQYPELDLRLLFQTAGKKLSGNSKTTYAGWADAHGFLVVDTSVGLKSRGQSSMAGLGAKRTKRSSRKTSRSTPHSGA